MSTISMLRGLLMSAVLATTTSGIARAAERVDVAALKEPRVAERDAMRVRVVNRPNHTPGVVRRAPQMDPVYGEAPADPRQAPLSYPAQETPQQLTVDGMPLEQKAIGLDILERAAAQEVGATPENFAAQLLPREQKYYVTRASRYREDFVIPVDLAASEFCYRPLYFQEVNLERYGTSHGPWQPFISGARFFATVPALPYMMTVHKPCVCRYWPHYYPAGRHAPCWEPEGLPFDPEGAGIEALAVYGLILLIP